MGPVRLFMGHPAPPPPPNSQKCTFLYIVAHIGKKTWQLFCVPLLHICLLCDDVLLP